LHLAHLLMLAVLALGAKAHAVPQRPAASKMALHLMAAGTAVVLSVLAGLSKESEAGKYIRGEKNVV
jgi:hypothetical protein